jgi:hypothetical protein
MNRKERRAAKAMAHWGTLAQNRTNRCLVRRTQLITTFWLSFNDPDAPPNERFRGVAIFDMDESEGELSVVENRPQSVGAWHQSWRKRSYSSSRVNSRPV